MITASYSGGPDPCLGYHLIQQDTAPVVLVVNITADPCPDEVTWYLNDTEITTDDNFDVSCVHCSLANCKHKSHIHSSPDHIWVL